VKVPNSNKPDDLLQRSKIFAGSKNFFERCFMAYSSRRSFVIRSVAGTAALYALSANRIALAQAQALVSDTDPQAVALGYKTDGSKTDTKKYPNYAASQSCSGCALFQGKATDASAPCAIFGNKSVSGKGWCSAWNKRA
jgi:High potential iron-sulfur protein